MSALLAFWSLLVGSAQASSGIRVFPGFVTKVQCEGRLLVSAVGNDELVLLEALPKELGCGVILKPTGKALGVTNLLLETSTGTIERELQVTAGMPLPSQRMVRLRAGGGE
jgi:hypothetical protein